MGAGPAGAAAAVTARKAGLSVALIDKARFPRDKLCGGLVSGRSLKARDRILGARPPRDIFQISRAVQFAWAGKARAVFDAPHDL
ncbi:MAG: NAD(P)-binding protein, partial [Rhodobacteraceae bacterium]|nr:NAD(P)-binding protein [Paracoccaceae bacterium]